MIYKQHDLKRMVGKLLTEDFNNDKTLEFTNTSYGGHGTVLGSLYSHMYAREKTLLYSVTHERYDDPTVKLIKEISDIKYKNTVNGKVVQEYSKDEKTETIKELYLVSGFSGSDDAVYTDNREEYEHANKIHTERYRNRHRSQQKKDGRTLITDPVKRMNAINYIESMTGVKLKKDVDIFVNLDRYSSTRYSYDLEKNMPYKKVSLYYHYTYRNESKCIKKCQFEY